MHASPICPCRFLTSVPPTHILPLHFDYSTPVATATVDLGLHLAPASRPVLSLIKDVWRSVIWTLDIDSIEYDEAGGYEADPKLNAQYHKYVPPQYAYSHHGARQGRQATGGTADPTAGHGPGTSGAFTEGSARRVTVLGNGGHRLLPAGQRVSPWIHRVVRLVLALYQDLCRPTLFVGLFVGQL